MITIESILCPTDLSPESDAALRYGVALAQAYEAKLFVCHGLETPLADESEVRKLIGSTIADYIPLINPRTLDWEVAVRAINGGDAASTIMQEAAERGVDLIVMQSRRRPHAAAVLGSTAEAVCHGAPCPVLVTHPRERDWVGFSTDQIELKRILVAHDFSAHSKVALSYAFSLAQEYQAEVHLIHVLSTRAELEAPRSEWLRTSAEDEFQQAARQLRSDVPVEAFLWCEVKAAVKEGRPSREVLAYAKEHKIDLICLGASGTGFSLRALFGSNADHILRHAPCPVFIARPPKQVS